METPRESLKPGSRPVRSLRQRMGLRGELLLAALPTATVLVVLAFVEALTSQRLLFASLASSSFLIYLDPQHGTNSVRTLIVSQLSAAVIGAILYYAASAGYFAAAGAMVLTILLMILTDTVHPPAVSTALSFALRTGEENNVVLFAMAVVMVAILVGLERFSLWLLAREARR